MAVVPRYAQRSSLVHCSHACSFVQCSGRLVTLARWGRHATDRQALIMELLLTNILALVILVTALGARTVTTRRSPSEGS